MPDQIADAAGDDPVAASYRQLADVYHDLLSRDGVEELLERLVKTVRGLIPVTSILVAETRIEERVLVPLVAEGDWPEDFLSTTLPFGDGLIGMAAERGRPILCNAAHLDPRAGHVAGTPDGEPEAIVSLPLVSGGVVIGAMSLYREGEGATFTPFEFELAKRFADAATLALQNARTRAELRERGRRDELTGLLNRRGFNELLASTLARAREDEVAVALLLIDIDDFKRVNDSHGHTCGDALLQHVSRLLDEATRHRDCVCRIGGDEFGVVLLRADTEQGRAVARRIEESVEAHPMLHGDEPVAVTVSTGAASTRETPPHAESLLREADRAMYRQKRERKPAVALRLVSEQ
ncbi:MAG TPA: sensor domain-containing diguanylate cyclase [Gaiellaceae bacterium]|nr:sensor domain-containing diguanylate cyclase [Gaiellaceae bacterium]